MMTTCELQFCVTISVLWRGWLTVHAGSAARHSHLRRHSHVHGHSKTAALFVLQSGWTAATMRIPLMRLLLFQFCALLGHAALVCDYQAEVTSFSYLSSVEIERSGTNFVVQMDSLNVGFGTSGVSSIDSK